jgi:hypothetical protein
MLFNWKKTTDYKQEYDGKLRAECEAKLIFGNRKK